MKKIWAILLLLTIIECRWASAQEHLRSDSLTVEDLEEMGVVFSHNNKLVLLESGAEKFDDMFKAIRQAKHFVYLEYFNFRNDSIGKVLFTILAKKANEGVKVRALFDGFGNDSNNRPLTKKHLKEMRKVGIDIHEFDPIVFPWINHAYHRDHRKIVIVDGVLAYTGGMNVADYYIHGKPEFGPWRDMHMRIEGGAVLELQRIFNVMWQKTTGEELESPWRNKEVQEASAPVFVDLKTDTMHTAGRKMLGIVDRVPIIRPKIMRKAYQAAIDNAQHSIQIVNPYFTLITNIKRSLERALKRGVKVEIMVSTKSDVKITPDVVAFRVHNLMKQGAHIYFYEEGFHHSKYMMIDSAFCTIGSANLNSRSLSYDYEVNAFIMDKGVTTRLQQIFEKDKLKSTYLTPENWKKRRTFGQRLKGRFFKILTPFI